ncbi:hypothetical protein DICPUDRAFT_50849 [Dictyostelium purpureum]|uniref:Calreticulin n=1 Tax=Dictyostelium purpureum TaxID=5786 RepID=F1A0N2_DICPU|nr:uncharacterized protein DICPUDRAFT_50849 [Dictyostelium purpureum]EGC30253.1 hypothetical protein DICPUDRAFT_50849 [Dictyostelium purpureum]|eukprot:XP_003293225.1 hypothetical protein DICPUDRAFT_50849 [Dictyostelium purpureum]
MRLLLLLVLVLLGLVNAKVYFEDSFDGDWESRWVISDWHKDDGRAGKLVHTAGKWYNDDSKKGIQTSEDARFYAASAEFPAFSNKDKDLVVQYTVKMENKMDCGGAYIKVLPSGLNQKEFNGDSEYALMLGFDTCAGSKKVHFIINYNGKNHLIKKEITNPPVDQLTHQYTFVMSPDNTYKVLIDNKEVQSGSITEDWEVLAPKQIKDPKESKPADWVDVKEIDDPADVKPADYDTIPATIVDPEAAKPEDWNDEDDGEWEAPTIANPEYKGEWKAKKIPNPEYKGEWVHPLIDNPEYKDDKEIYKFDNLNYIGFELWQVKSGTIFNNFFISDSLEEAKEFSEKTFVNQQEGEKKMFDELEAKRVEEEKKKAEEAKKAKEEAEKVAKETEEAEETEEATEEELVKTEDKKEEKKEEKKASKKSVKDEL